MRYNWINDTIKIDFTVSRVLKNTMQEAETADLAKDMAEYNGLADILDVLAKESFANGTITRDQWRKIVNRYPMA